MYKTIKNITYKHLNQATEVDFGTKKTVYTYTATGTKLKTEIYSGTTLKSTTEYCGAFVYEDNKLSFINIPGGRIRRDVLHASHYEYNLTDHLGNVRVTFTKNKTTGDAEIVQEDHYYPFGMRMNGQHFSNTELINKYLYNGKEQQEQTNYYDYGFRQMDPQLGRWHVVDALAESYLSHSPYAYTMNDPINHVDVLGLGARPDGTDYNQQRRFYRNNVRGQQRYGDDKDFIYRDNGINSLMGLNTAHLNNPGRNIGGSFENYWKKVNGKWVYPGYKVKGYFQQDENGNIKFLTIDGASTISFEDGTNVSDIITTNADGSRGVNWEGLADYFGDNDDESSTGGDNPDTGKEMGPIGVGISIELAFPGMKRIYGHRGMGISFGFVADVKGLSWYYTRKTAERGLACSVSPEAFYVDGADGKVYNDILNNYGYSESAGYGPYGIEFGADNGADSGQKPKYYQYSLSGFAKGFDYSAVSWKTYTTITNLVYPKK